MNTLDRTNMKSIRRKNLVFKAKQVLKKLVNKLLIGGTLLLLIVGAVKLLKFITELNTNIQITIAVMTVSVILFNILSKGSDVNKNYNRKK